MERDLLVRGVEQAEVLEEAVAEAVWVETVRDQVLEVIVFVRIADREFLINGDCRVIR